MIKRLGFFLAASVLFALTPAAAQTPPNFVRVHDDVFAITHVTLIDGTGGPPRTDQTVVVEHGRIAAMGRHVRIPSGARQIDGHGKTLIPGIVGMHEHMFTLATVGQTPVAVEQFVQAPLLYLASGVTFARTTGSVDPYSDLALKRGIESGEMIGPDLDLSTPYIEGSPPAIPQLYPLRNADEAREMVRYWHSLGFSSVKAYAEITADELGAAIDEAHHLNMRVTGHLCSVGYEQAVALGIDNLEHGPFVSPDGDLDPARTPGQCASPRGQGQGMVSRDIVPSVDPNSPQLAHLIQVLVSHHVPITSTLAVIEGGSHLHLEGNPRLRALLAPSVWADVNDARASEMTHDAYEQALLQKEMAFERAFVAAGGVLLVGCDPTGDGHTIAGLGDQRNIELLIEAGFNISQAIHFATMNGAVFEGRDHDIGSIEVGKRADLVLLNGDLVHDVNVIEHPEIVFKNGVGYDLEAIYASLAGEVGLH